MAGSRKMEKDGERNFDVFDLFISVTRYALRVTFLSKRVNKLLLQSLSTRQLIKPQHYANYNQ